MCMKKKRKLSGLTPLSEYTRMCCALKGNTRKEEKDRERNRFSNNQAQSFMCVQM